MKRNLAVACFVILGVFLFSGCKDDATINTPEVEVGGGGGTATLTVDLTDVTVAKGEFFKVDVYSPTGLETTSGRQPIVTAYTTSHVYATATYNIVIFIDFEDDGSFDAGNDFGLVQTQALVSGTPFTLTKTDGDFPLPLIEQIIDVTFATTPDPLVAGTNVYCYFLLNPVGGPPPNLNSVVGYMWSEFNTVSGTGTVFTDSGSGIPAGDYYLACINDVDNSSVGPETPPLSPGDVINFGEPLATYDGTPLVLNTGWMIPPP